MAPRTSAKESRNAPLYLVPGEIDFQWLEVYPEPPYRTKNSGTHRHAAHRCRERVEKNSQLCGYLPQRNGTASLAAVLRKWYQTDLSSAL